MMTHLHRQRTDIDTWLSQTDFVSFVSVLDISEPCRRVRMSFIAYDSRNDHYFVIKELIILVFIILFMLDFIEHFWGYENNAIVRAWI